MWADNYCGEGQLLIGADDHATYKFNYEWTQRLSNNSDIYVTFARWSVVVNPVAGSKKTQLLIWIYW